LDESKGTMFCNIIIHINTFLHFIFNKNDKLMKILDANFLPFCGQQFSIEKMIMYTYISKSL